METRIIAGCEIKKPTTVMGLENIRKVLVEQGTEAALKAIDNEIEQRWAIDGFWRNVHLEEVY